MKYKVLIFLYVVFSFSLKAQEGRYPFFDGTDSLTTELMQNAEARIDTLRKGDLILELVDKSGEKVNTNARIELKWHNFDFGANSFNFHKIEDSDPGKSMALKAIDSLFNMVIVCDYWSSNQSAPNATLYWSHPDTGFEVAEELDKKSRYHALIFGFPHRFDGYTEEEVWGFIEQRIKNIADRYGDKITEVDVINEFINYQYWSGNHPDYLRSVNFPDFAKPENGKRVLEIARKHLPNSKLTVLEANIWSTTNPVFQEIYQYHKSLIEMEVDYDYIGYQAHYYAKNNVPFQEGTNDFGPRTFMMDEISKGLDQMGELGKPIVITEFNPPSRNNKNTNPDQPGITDEEIAAWETNFYTLMFSKPYMKGISRWFTVDNLGGRGMDAGVVTEDGKLKPNYFALKKLIKEKWHTKWEGEVRGENVDFNGFYGTYTVKVDGYKDTVVNFTSDSTYQKVTLKSLLTSVHPIIKDKERITVYPNPFNHTINIKGIESGNIKIYSITGEVLFETLYHSGDKVDLSALKPGIYLLTSDGEIPKSCRIIKTH